MATESSAIFNFFSQLSEDVAINGDVTDLASERGIFNSKSLNSVDYNTILKQGFYTVYSTGSTNGPGGARRLIVLNDTGGDNDAIQIAVTNQPSSDKNLHLDIRAFHPTVGWIDWTRFISEHDVATALVAGIMKPGDGLEAEEDGVINVDDTVVRTSGAQKIKGVKTFNDQVHLSKSGLCRYVLQNLDLPAQRTDNVSVNTYTRLDFYNEGGLDNAKNRMANLIFTKFTNGNSALQLNCVNPYNDDSEEYCQLTCGWGKHSDGTPFPYVSCPTPAANSNNNYIVTTEWVRNYTPPSSNKLTTARSIDGINFNGEENVVHYTTCSTDAAIADKVVSLDNFVLSSGAKVYVKFTIANTASNPTLNVSGTGAKAIQFNNENIPASYLKIGLYEFVYDGTYWNFIGGGEGLYVEDGKVISNFDSLINAGWFFVASSKGATINAPMDVTAEWWVNVLVCGSGTGRRILQEARMHTTTTSSATSGPSHILVRCCSNTTWGPWQYSYSQFAE